MKYSKAKIQECAEWVEKNGLYPQNLGAPLAQFCEAMDIDDATYRRWMGKTEFADALAHARKVFKSNRVHETVNTLFKVANGYTWQKTKQEGRSGTDGVFKTSRATKEDVQVPPNIEAIKFILTNMDPENWKNKQDTTTGISLNMEEPPVIVFADTSQTKEEE